MELEELVREQLKAKGNNEIKLTIPAHYLERMVNWFDFCEGEGFSKDFDTEILKHILKETK